MKSGGLSYSVDVLSNELLGSEIKTSIKGAKLPVYAYLSAARNILKYASATTQNPEVVQCPKP
jgi:hypothetical protein